MFFFFKYKIFCPLEFVQVLIEQIFTYWVEEFGSDCLICVGLSRATFPPPFSKIIHEYYHKKYGNDNPQMEK